MDEASACPKCGYVRSAADTAPSWQCPSCGIAIEKYRAAAAVNALAAALVPGQTREEVPRQLPLDRRLASALPDFLSAGLFLWCWMAPGAWRPALVSELGLLMLMEFFVLHSSMFLVMGSGEGGVAAKLTLAFFVMLFYIPVAGAFVWWHGGWWPMLGFAWLLTTKVAGMLAGQGSAPFEAKRGRFYWGSAAGYYVAFAFIAVLLPMPKLGFNGKAPYAWDAFWNISPQAVMAWGFLYFGALGVTRALEKPQWIADTE